VADYENETLEETQKRLASQAGSASSPWVNRPSGAIPPPPPYVGGTTAASVTVPTGIEPFTKPAPTRRRGILIAVAVLGTVAVLGVAITIALGSSTLRPPVDAIWIDYPGNAYAEPAEVLASDSKEAVVADAEAFLTAYREELTAELGMDWTQVWDGSLDYGSNYYDGESLLWDYSSGEWQGSVRMSEPGSRDRVAQIFERLTAVFGASDYRFNNALYADDAAQSEEQFGAAALDEQAVWSFTGSGDESRSQLRMVSRAWDRSLSTSDTFTGDVWFDPESAGSDLFVVTVSLWSNDLLADADRAEFIERLKAYEGLDRPEPN